MWSHACLIVGVATMWYVVNPVSVFLLSMGVMTRWTIVAHHVCHGGFDKCSNGEYNRFKFGVGSLYRRVCDWLDWMLVEAWNVEHNQLHHYHLGEDLDPDLVETNLSTLREANLPRPVKYVSVLFFMLTWKWYYYAPNTFKMLKLHEMRRVGKTPKLSSGKVIPDHWLTAPWVISPIWALKGAVFFTNSEFFGRVLAPFFIARFVLLPGAVGLLLGRQAATNSLISIVLAELLTNAHSFLNIVTNHVGDDLYRFDRSCEPRSSTFYMRQVISSANFRTGSDINDFVHGWLNYQIEHHLWPDLSMLSYQKAQPLVKAICAKHGVPYVQESVWRRLKKTVDVMVGDASMRKFPSKYANEADLKEPK